MGVTIKGHGTVQAEGPDGVEVTETVDLQTEAPDGGDDVVHPMQLSRVTVGLGCTVKTFDYENARPYVQVELACSFNDIDAAYAFAKEWVDAKLAEQVAEIKKAVAGD